MWSAGICCRKPCHHWRSVRRGYQGWLCTRDGSHFPRAVRGDSYFYWKKYIDLEPIKMNTCLKRKTDKLHFHDRSSEWLHGLKKFWIFCPPLNTRKFWPFFLIIWMNSQDTKKNCGENFASASNSECKKCLDSVKEVRCLSSINLIHKSEFSR